MGWYESSLVQVRRREGRCIPRVFYGQFQVCVAARVRLLKATSGCAGCRHKLELLLAARTPAGPYVLLYGDSPLRLVPTTPGAARLLVAAAGVAVKAAGRRKGSWRLNLSPPRASVAAESIPLGETITVAGYKPAAGNGSHRPCHSRPALQVTVLTPNPRPPYLATSRPDWPALASGRQALLELLRELRQPHPQRLAEGSKLHHIQAAFAALAFADERLRGAEAGRQLRLRQPRGPSTGPQLAQEDGVLRQVDRLLHVGSSVPRW